MARLAWLPGRALLICVDGLASYATAFWRAFREKVRTGRRGRLPYRPPGCARLARLVKSYSGRRLKEVVRRVLWGSKEQVEEQLRKTQTGQQINTPYTEGLNATFRACLAPLVRRGRALAHKGEVLGKAMYLAGWVYNFCRPHRSLRARQQAGKKWRLGTPARAAGWMDHVWSVQELLSFKRPVPLHG
jgi:hypothetical protein